jgi:hypothetical protein
MYDLDVMCAHVHFLAMCIRYFVVGGNGGAHPSIVRAREGHEPDGISRRRHAVELDFAGHRTRCINYPCTQCVPCFV